MKSNFLLYFCVAAITIFTFACSEKPDDKQTTYISGSITIDPEVDSTGNNSGIHLFIPAPNRLSSQTDTLFHAVTDSTGAFFGIAETDRKDIYSVIISRNRNTFGVINMVLAEGDSIELTATLPNINETAEFTSIENDVMQVFNRVDRNFSRVAQFISAGAMSADSVGIELSKWSDIYWEIFEENPGTHAAHLAGERSLSMLSGINDSLMIDRKEKVLEEYQQLMPNTRQVLLNYYANEGGLERALQFLDQLIESNTDESEEVNLEIERIELLYDSSRTNEANENLDRFTQKFSDDSLAVEWAESIRYDLEFLAPGSPFPTFEFVTVTGDTISNETMRDKPFLIEITRLDNQMYQTQYDRTIAIYQIYRNFGLEIITVPLGTNQIVMEAFFEERNMFWNFVQPNTIDSEELIEDLNINRLPTRFLINRDGTIIRRYIGNEFQDVVRGLQQITTEN